VLTNCLSSVLMRHTCTSTLSSCCTTLYSPLYRSLASEVLFLYSTHTCIRLTLQRTAFDQDINAKAALAFPQLYVRGIRGLEYTRLKFWLYMGDGLYQSGVVFFIPYFVWTLGLVVSWNGKGIDSLSDFGTTIAVAAIFAANCYVGINTH
jgi:hypothetical protein